MANNNKNLNNAKKARRDEFYTSYYDIYLELSRHEGEFKNKIVYCNCDDPDRSAFWDYFHIHFKDLGLKALVSTCYREGSTSFKKEYFGGNDPAIGEGLTTPLQGNGDFRSPECVEILRACDVVVTNPPFSLFRDFMKLVLSCGKKFLVIGSMQACHYSEIFPCFQRHEIWFTGGPVGKGMKFYMPSDYPLTASIHGVDEDGRKFAFCRNTRWITNFLKANAGPIPLTREYNPVDFPTYDNYDGIEVGSYKSIPADYDGLMGVPITFFEHFDPARFEVTGRGKDCKVNGRCLFERIFIRRKTGT